MYISKKCSIFAPEFGQNNHNKQATPQIEVSLREIAAHEGNDIESYALAIDDFLGTKIKKTYTELVGNRYWKCGKCLRIYRRDICGEIIAQVHTSVESYYTPSQSKQNKVSSNSINFNTFLKLLRRIM